MTHSIPFASDHPPDFFAQFPAAAAVFLLRGADEGAEPYVSKTANLRRRLQRLLAPPESQSKRLNLRERVARIDYSLAGSDFESALLLYKVLRQEFPENYNKRLRLRPAPLVRLNLENEYPRAYVTSRVGKMTGKLTGRSLYYGPFASRTVAEKFMNDSLDLFKMRRCTFDLEPDPKFPGCIYSEMKMCLAPCFKGCTDQDYAAEVARVQAYFDSGGQSLLREMEEERERLSAALDFEAAAQQHAKVAKLKGILSAWDEICRRLDRLDAVIIQPSFIQPSFIQPSFIQPAFISPAKSVALFRFCKGELAGPEPFPVKVENETEPLESRLRAALEQLTPAAARSSQQFTEGLAMLKRWYYRSHKVGEIIFAKEDGALPMRRLVNAIGRVHRGEQTSENTKEHEEKGQNNR